MTTAPAFTDAATDALVQRARSGDQAAFRELWVGVGGAAHALCLRLTGNYADAADALQDTQIAVWRHLDRYHGRCPFRAWVIVVARNAARAVLRSRGRRPEPVPDVGLVVDRAASGPFPDDGPDTLGSVQDALERLPERQREAVLLRAGGLGYDEIAALMDDASEANVRLWVHRARGRLRAELGH